MIDKNKIPIIFLTQTALAISDQQAAEILDRVNGIFEMDVPPTSDIIETRFKETVTASPSNEEAAFAAVLFVSLSTFVKIPGKSLPELNIRRREVLHELLALEEMEEEAASARREEEMMHYG